MKHKFHIKSYYNKHDWDEVEFGCGPAHRNRVVCSCGWESREWEEDQYFGEFKSGRDKDFKLEHLQKVAN